MREHLEYLSYVIRHKWFVLVAGLVTGAPLWRLLVHDLSKFRPSEWGPYAARFYGAPKQGETVTGVAGDARFEGEVVVHRGGRTLVYVHQLGQQTRELQLWTEPGEIHRRLEVEARFDRAWLLHQNRNAHHWQYWLLANDDGSLRVLPMPEPLVREMVADWLGAGRAITGRYDLEWYERNRPQMQLHPETQRLVELVLEEVREHRTFVMVDA